MWELIAKAKIDELEREVLAIETRRRLLDALGGRQEADASPERANLRGRLFRRQPLAAGPVVSGND